MPAYSVTSTPGHLRGLVAAGSAERSRPSLSTEDGQEYRRRRAELHRLLGNLMAAELVAAMIRVTLK